MPWRNWEGWGCCGRSRARCVSCPAHDGQAGKKGTRQRALPGKRTAWPLPRKGGAPGPLPSLLPDPLKGQRPGREKAPPLRLAACLPERPLPSGVRAVPVDLKGQYAGHAVSQTGDCCFLYSFSEFGYPACYASLPVPAGPRQQYAGAAHP